MKRSYYSASIADFLNIQPDQVLGKLVAESEFDIDKTQVNAWQEEIAILRNALKAHEGFIHFEYSVPRLGSRIDVVLLIGSVILVLEFKVGERQYLSAASDQVWDYGLDLKYFHETSFDRLIVPVLIATEGERTADLAEFPTSLDNLLSPIRCNRDELARVIDWTLKHAHGSPIEASTWSAGRYRPTPSIVEVAMALYRGHSVDEISRSDAATTNLSVTSQTVAQIIESSRANSEKAICFVTGVPGAGKTLVGLNIATTHIEKSSELYSVFLSGNGPLVAILREALARDKSRRHKAAKKHGTLGAARREVKMFIQAVHSFRNEYLIDSGPPLEHVAIFDEAQRAWNEAQTTSFMRRKKKHPHFGRSEPEFLISCMDRHRDWAVIVCLVGGGQEIHTGEAGISEWIDSLSRSFPLWRIYVSSRLTDSEYAAGHALEQIKSTANVMYKDELHLAVSMRSFRAEHVSLLVKQLLDLDSEAARSTLSSVKDRYPIVITRDLASAKAWLKHKARGTERYGIVVSSNAERLRPHAIHVKAKMDPVHWFLDGKHDVRSSYYLEDVATEFSVQGLELDWACITWDADFRQSGSNWQHWSFVGDRWNRIKKRERQAYQKNAYRVLLTRARQGMVIVVPNGDLSDPTRKPEYYDPTFEYLQSVGFDVL